MTFYSALLYLWYWVRAALGAGCWRKASHPALLCWHLATACGWLRHRPPLPAMRGFYPAHPPSLQRHRKKAAWVATRLVRLKAMMPTTGCRKLADIFNRQYGNHPRHPATVSKSYVATILRRDRLAIVRLRRELKHRVPHSVPRNQTWAIDLTGKQDAAGVVHDILGIIDHGSRRFLGLQLCLQSNALTLLGHLFLAMGRYGVPRNLRSDNAAVFTGRWFRWGLALVGIRQRLSDPGCPWQNPIIERAFGTLKQVLNPLAVASSHTLAQLLSEFDIWYNAVRPHQHLDGATPLEVWHGIDPYRNPVKIALPVEFWNGRLQGVVLRH